MKHLIYLPCLCLAFSAAAQSGAVDNGVISSNDLVKRWNSAETRSLFGGATEKRTALVSDGHLAALKAAGATRGIAVVPVGGGQSQVTCNIDPASAVTFQNILFKLNSTELADAKSLRQIEEIASAIRQAREKSLLLEGHTCDLGTDGHNRSLSERRAAAIRVLLVARGVQPSRLVPLGFGESQPAVPNTSETNREENRRVVIAILQ